MIYIASDHNGFDIKNSLITKLAENGVLTQDLGPFEYIKEDDYPLFAFDVAEKVVANEESFGILICKSGVGMVIAANRVKGARASIIKNEEIAYLSRKDDNCNIIVFDTLTFNIDEALKIIIKFINTNYSKEERFQRRLNQINDYESQPSNIS